MTRDEIERRLNSHDCKIIMRDNDDVDEGTVQLLIEIDGARYLVHANEADGSVIHFENV